MVDLLSSGYPAQYVEISQSLRDTMKYVVGQYISNLVLHNYVGHNMTLIQHMMVMNVNRIKDVQWLYNDESIDWENV